MISTPRRRDFFYPGPVLGKPGADHLLVALGGLRLWLLHAPARLPQQVAQAAGVVADPELALDELPDARERPAVALEAGGHGPAVEQAAESALLLRRQLARAARRMSPAQGTPPFGIELALPLADRRGRSAEVPGDLGLRQLALL